MQTVVWFSCGVTSAVAAKLALAEWPDAEVCRYVIESEHPDNDRFAADVSSWLGKSITELRHSRYKTHFDVIAGERFIRSYRGAKCTTELKRKLGDAYRRKQSGPTLNVYGFDANEVERAEDFRETFQDIHFVAPLIEAGLTKADCKVAIERAGIALPAMYLLGYEHNNCIGCVKGGKGYWNRIRQDFPDVFKRMATAERDIGSSCIRSNGNPTYLDELDPRAGRFDKDQPRECGIFCDAQLEAHGL
jgi:hypothetical protein